MMSITANAGPRLIAKLSVMGSHNRVVPCLLAADCDYDFKNCADEVLTWDPAAHPLPCWESQINIYCFS